MPEQAPSGDQVPAEYVSVSAPKGRKVQISIDSFKVAESVLQEGSIVITMGSREGKQAVIARLNNRLASDSDVQAQPTDRAANVSFTGWGDWVIAWGETLRRQRREKNESGPCT